MHACTPLIFDSGENSDDYRITFQDEEINNRAVL
jgi:hypothetical protein